jgi:hypothetical protein
MMSAFTEYVKETEIFDSWVLGQFIAPIKAFLV